ncbi:MAG TPA: delta-class carbonic anhydrase [Thermoanaerobaculia bacterium]
MSKRYSVVVSILSVVVLAGTSGAALAAECPPAPVASCELTGPQSPRDIENTSGRNKVKFSKAPPVADMRLCDIHFHKLAEHKIPATEPAPGGQEGYVCRAMPPSSPREPVKAEPHHNGCGGILLGDTIEVHWVFTTCNVEPAPCLTSCFSAACINPELRVETQVFYLTTPPNGEDWARAGYPSLPPGAGPGTVEYLGSTTGDAYDGAKCSPFQATWKVRPDCRRLTLESLNKWCDDNPFDEDHAHGVRNLVSNPELLSRIEP